MSTTTQETASTPSAPRPSQRQSYPARAAALLRNGWRALTSMRIALVLLFLLALAAIPGALLPQRSLNDQKVEQYIADHALLGPWLDRLQLFEVFSSSWFTAIYVLLFISLIGCILPRCIDYAKALRARPVATPRNLSRMPHYERAELDAGAQDIADRITAGLRRWRTEVRTGTGKDGEITISAERGYVRELGNLVFHLALLALLAAIAIGKLFSYEGNVIVIADGGPGFCSSSPAAFDSFRAGNVVDGTSLTPICVKVDDFAANYLPNGQADQFTAHIEYQTGKDIADNRWRKDTLQVNHPLRVAGDRVYLQGHGFAPIFTVTFPNGQTRTQTLQFRPDDMRSFLSSGAMRFDPPAGLYPTEALRRKNQIAIEGLFAPTASFDGGLMTSTFPAMQNPGVAIDIYKGDTGLDTGLPQSLFSLDHGLVTAGQLTKVKRVNLTAGQFVTLDDGKTQIRFDGAREFVNLQVSHNPAQNWVLISSITMMLGLLVSILVKRRRVWARIVTRGEGDQRRTVVELAGLARTDQAGWGDEFTKLCKRLLSDDAAASGSDKTAAAKR